MNALWIKANFLFAFCAWLTIGKAISLPSSSNDFTKYQVELSIDEQLDLTSTLFTNSIYSIDIEDYKDNLENFYFFDFNKDSIVEILFIGKNPIGNESSTSALFLKTAEKYNPVFILDGNINAIETDSISVQFNLFFSSCCAQIFEGFLSISINMDQLSSPKRMEKLEFLFAYNSPKLSQSFKINEIYYFPRSTYFPNQVKTSNKLMISNDYILVNRLPAEAKKTGLNWEEDHLFWDSKALTWHSIPPKTNIRIISQTKNYSFIEFNVPHSIKYDHLDFYGQKMVGWIKKSESLLPIP